ncbi:hypothetical protein CIB48_g5306 [Xylaria polymorpha]|nr:hypothetical protein CIB48_g5306 [Xylaria polymorpha]
MVHWIQTNNPYSYEHLDVLLAALDLHGFGNLLNADNEPISAMIRKKVMAKVCRVRIELRRRGGPPAPAPAPVPAPTAAAPKPKQ